MSGDAVEVFFSYSHKDEALRDQLATHLKLLERQGIIAAWHDRKIVPGSEWAGNIHHYLERADIILLLISADFLASDYCWDVEIQNALERHEVGTTTVIPVILRPVDWSSAPFARLQALPKNAQPVVTWAPPDLAFMDIAKGIRLRAEELVATRQAQAAQTQRQAALGQYRQKLKTYLAAGPLSFIARENLDDLAQNLGLSQADTAALDTEETALRNAYVANLERYGKTFRRALDHEYPLSDVTKTHLRERQSILTLGDFDVQQLETSILADWQIQQQQRQQAQEVAAQRQNDLNQITMQTVKVDERGRICEKPSAQVSAFSEDLGNNIGLDMVAIPAGEFVMGSPPEEEGRDADEGPQRTVTVPSFFMGRFQVTQAQYEAVMGENPSRFQGANRPVEKVSWNDAVAFCEKLTDRTGRTYRLPSEAEWEYACRSGTTTPFAFGPTITTDLANYDGNFTYGSGPKGVYREETTDVGSFPPNAFGLYDMHGNVYEWCQDVWHNSYEGAPMDGSAWRSGGDQAQRVLRGGSWFDDPVFCRSANRYVFSRVILGSNVGFRVVWVPA